MWCTTECWNCEDRKCEHYISKTELYFENEKLKHIINDLRELLKRYQNNEYYYKYHNKYLKSEIKENISQILDKESDNNE